MQEWWNAYAAERLLAGEILAWGAFLAVMFMLIAMASIKYQQAFMTYFRADDVPADEFLAQQNRAFAARHAEMLDNGFSVWQTMRLKCTNPPFQAAMAVYRHEGRRSLVGVLYALNGQQACYTDIFEEYADGSSLTVSNIPQAAHPLIPQLPIRTTRSITTRRALSLLMSRNNSVPWSSPGGRHPHALRLWATTILSNRPNLALFLGQYLIRRHLLALLRTCF